MDMTREEAEKYIKSKMCNNCGVYLGGGKCSDNCVVIEAIKTLSQEPSRDMEEIAEIMKSDADAETKCKMIFNILTAKPHYFEVSQKQKTIQEKQAESEKYQKAYDDGYDNGYAQAKFDYEQEPCEACGYAEGSQFCIQYCPYDAERRKEKEPCNKCVHYRTSICGNCKNYDEFEQESCNDVISRKSIKQKLQECHDFFVNAYGGFSNLPQNDKSRVDEITNCIAMVVNEPPVIQQAMEQETCDNAVSREDTMTALRTDPSFICPGDKLNAIRIVECMPPVTLQQKVELCDDAVSRILKRMWNCRGKHTTSIDKVKMEQIIRDELSSFTQKSIECDDEISRERALAPYKDLNDDDVISVRLIKKNITELPPVTPQQKSGKWIDYRDEGFVECPFCGYATTCEDNIDELHYCFYCGAKMVEPQESEDKESSDADNN